MAEKRFRGIESSKIQKNPERDIRSVGQKFFDWIKVPVNMSATLGAHAAVAFLAPAWSDLVLLSALAFFVFAMTRKETAPLKMPMQTKLKDPNQPNPANGRPSDAKGIFFLGNEIKTGKEIWLTNDDCRQHFLVIGTTGAGKTETLLGFAANALLWGSGFLFCDGKGDVALFAKVYALARRFGREDDILVLNFMTGNQDLGGGSGKVISNTMNPFVTGSSDSLTQMVVSLMDDVGGDGAMWKGRATAMLTGVMRALCWLRDQGNIDFVDLNVGTIRDFMALRRIIDLADTSRYPDLPPNIRKSIRAYLTSLPGYQEEKRDKQSQTTLDQHGYLEMQFTKILGSLADVYGHIFKTESGEVDMTDVVLNRRILVIMLPALEKSGDEIANLGKIVVAALKGMMGSTLGSQIEGDWAHIVDNRPTNSPSPFVTILDEVGYYTVEGMALMAAQARSLGFMLVYASQDIPAMMRLNDKESASIIANTNTKIWMRLEEMEKSGKLAIEGAGKELRVQGGSFQGKSGEFGIGYMDNLDARFEQADVINPLDLKAQESGEMHVVHKDIVIRARGFYANPEGAVDKGKLKLRANHFIKVPRPDPDEIESDMRAPEILKRLIDPALPKQLQEAAAKDVAAARAKVAAKGGQPVVDEIALAADAVERLLTAKRTPVEAASAAIGAVLEARRAAKGAFRDSIRKSAGFDAEPVPVRKDDAKETKPGFMSLRDEARPRQAAGVPAEQDAATKTPERSVGFVAPDPVETKQKTYRKSPLRKDVRHAVRIDDDNRLVDMAADISANETIMRALAALDFDPAGPEAKGGREAVERHIERTMFPDEYVEEGPHTDMGVDYDDVHAIERINDVAPQVDEVLTDIIDVDRDSLEEDESGDGGESEYATAFLESLLKDD